MRTIATLHLMIGLPCSGKTTLARELEKKYSALRLTPDEWHIPLYGHDLDEKEHEARHDLVECMLWDLAARVLVLGVDVILDFGCWARSERDDFRSRAAELGADFKFIFLTYLKRSFWSALQQEMLSFLKIRLEFQRKSLKSGY
ncbi:AAA family ATPase [Lederbergia citrea]|uniref:AAA family ATPase n=1 Tax=Lederbergia citrea TaxID=2833581 RepID=A0A942URH2_9BACI|nr:AAA family ATPase [Lederbergia citrea]MBS4223608.1 AAA family ATPase [Lederbergia citrea]